MIKVLILGGSGILSLDVLKECVKRGYNVTCVTRGTRDYRLPKGINVIRGDIHKIEDFSDKLSENYDAVLDFLSFDVKDLKYKLDNLASRCKQYFFVSSAVAYSFEDEIITEKTKLGNEYWDYGSNKIKCEEFLRKNSEKYGIIYTIIRPYVTYGKTRIPFGIIPESGEYWTLINRIINKKPILLWDDGKARCTLTNTEDFAKAYVDLICNPKAYNEAFHITSNEVLTWAEVLKCLGNELNETPVVFSRDTQEIIKLLPEYKGLLLGDKARDRIFDNRKIVEAAPNFVNLKPFSEGIAETIKNYQDNPVERTMNYEWDGRIDWAIIRFAKASGESLDSKKLKYIPAEEKDKLIWRISYLRGRYPKFGSICSLTNKIFRLHKKVIKCMLRAISKIKNKVFHKKRTNQEVLKSDFHGMGKNCKIENCDFGLDRKLISIGNNVHIQNDVKFVNYRPSAEHFDKILGNGNKKTLRDLGPIVIEDNVFIGRQALIMPNVTIGRNSLILEGSVIVSSIPENSVVYGNPGRVVDNIEKWYTKLVGINELYPWYEKDISHDEIVKMREDYFFED